MRRFDDRRALATAVWRTWGARGLVRRASYEVGKRTGALLRAEQRWCAQTPPPTTPLRSAGITPPAVVTPPDEALVDPGGGVRLYGGLTVAATVPPDWHRHPITGHRYPADDHWSLLSDADPHAGDIKDVWELSRLGWLQPWLRRWAVTGADADAELIWEVIEDWHALNPRYRGPHWMCGQETSLRTLAVMFAADALDASPATTPARRLLVAAMVSDAVGRVAPTLSYALSQRNNHASSEAGFLWSATVLAPWLTDAANIRDRASRALSEVVVDQFAPDGSYAQHSPTYQRVALHVLLWCLAVARATGEEPPAGVTDAVRRSIGHLTSLVTPGSGGRVPNLGGNDGALVFDLAPLPITDFRPLLAHAAAALGEATSWGPGVWDEEAAWFGLAPASDRSPRPTSDRRSTGIHALTRGSAHAILRAGPVQHRPAHADQLHLDIWLAGAPVAVDAGSYRYTALPPWANALAGEEVHNLPRVPGVPQAVRSGRFFWRRWCEARTRIVDEARTVAATAELELPDATVLHRRVVVQDGLVVVTDWTSKPEAEVRWNLVDATVTGAAGQTTVVGPGWQARLIHAGVARVPERSIDDPASGWAAPTYGVRSEVTPVISPCGADHPMISVFATDAAATRLDQAAAAARQTFDQRPADDTSNSRSSTFDARSRRS